MQTQQTLCGFQLPTFCFLRCRIFPTTGTNERGLPFLRNGLTEEEPMPVILLWGIPTMFVIVGGGYWLMHLHH